jgi:uncharacterized protein YbjT (DUF2867 family)
MAEIAILGAAGFVGKTLIGALNAAGASYSVISHSDLGAARLRDAGAPEPVRADLRDVASLTRVFANASVVYAIPPALHPREDEYLINAVRAAQRSGSPRFVYHSVLHSNTPFLRNHQRKARVEAALRASGLRWSILQPSMYAQVVLAMFGSAHGNTVEIPFDVDAELSILDLLDCAAVGLRTLLESGPHDYATYELAGPMTSMRQAIAAMGRARGIELHAKTAAMTSGRLPPAATHDAEMAADMMSTYAHYHRHGFRGNPFVLTQLLGRSPRSIEEVIAREYGAN